ncbi:MAG: ASKHA domain-containing protein [Desulfococcaceae bacterium]
MSENESHPPTGLPFPVRAQEPPADAAARRNLSIRMDCGGRGMCGQCRIFFPPDAEVSPPTDAELRRLPDEARRKGARLACQVAVHADTAAILPPASRIVAEALGKDGPLAPVEPAPLVQRIFIAAADRALPTDRPGLALADELARRAESATGRPVQFRDRELLRALSRETAPVGDATLVHHDERGVTAILPGHRRRSLGLAVDVGTTTLAAYLCDLTTGVTLAGASTINPQGEAGEDVISRIAFCDAEPDGLERLRNLAVTGINRLVADCLAAADADPADIDEAVLAGNTTMQHILAGLSPHGLGTAPYAPAVGRFPDLPAAELGLDLSPSANVHLFPAVSGFVGGDTLAAVLAEEMDDRERNTLLVDIGTNGELVLGRRDLLWATSCATGPALEGMQMAHGMRAGSGAIDRIALGPNNTLEWRVVGTGRPLGLCGSAYIDAAAALRRVGGLLPNGRFNPDFPGVAADDRGIGRRFVLVPASESGAGQEIAITLRDIRQLQLAKAALAAGVDFLMEKIGVADGFDTVLTGSFGARFNWQSAVAIGMLPPAVLSGTVTPKMNLAGVGAVMALVNRRHRAHVDRLYAKTRFVEMAMDPRFAEIFARATAFPDPPVGVDPDW